MTNIEILNKTLDSFQEELILVENQKQAEIDDLERQHELFVKLLKDNIPGIEINFDTNGTMGMLGDIEFSILSEKTLYIKHKTIKGKSVIEKISTLYAGQDVYYEIKKLRFDLANVFKQHFDALAFEEALNSSN